jgi:hypothetical protein
VEMLSWKDEEFQSPNHFTYNHSKVSFQQKKEKFFQIPPRPCVAFPYLLANVRLLPPPLSPPTSGGEF